MLVRSFAEGRALGKRSLLACLQLALGCSPFEAPLAREDAAVDAGQVISDAGVAPKADSAADANIDIDAAHPATVDAAADAAEVDAQVAPGTDAAVVDAAVFIPKRPTLVKCGFATPITTGQVTASSLNEVSGLAVSRANPRVIWAIEDSGNGAEINALNDQGALIATYSLIGDALDYEDVSIGPGPVAGQSYLYIADIGDNHGDRPNVVVYRAPEPTVVWNQAFVTGALTAVEPFPLKYPNGVMWNAESLIVDPATSDIYVITKDGFSRPNTLFRLAAPQQPATLRVVEEMGPTFGGVGTDLATTAADISADGKHIAIRTLHSAAHWSRADGVSIADTILKGTPCDAELAAEDKGESFGFSTNGYYTVSEGLLEPLHFVSYTH